MSMFRPLQVMQRQLDQLEQQLSMSSIMERKLQAELQDNKAARDAERREAQANVSAMLQSVQSFLSVRCTGHPASLCDMWLALLIGDLGFNFDQHMAHHLLLLY